MSWLESRWYSDQPAPCWLKPLESLFCLLAKRKSNTDKSNQWSPDNNTPVVIVGNISVGGTGKTPLVEFLVNLLRQQGYLPGIVSRGYKSKATHYPYLVDAHSSAADVGDEPFLLYKRCQCPIAVDPDRASAARFLLNSSTVNVIISDDGMQHYKLARDIEIAVIDGKRGLGNGRCLPMGPLREAPSRLQSVDFVITNGALEKPIHVLEENDLKSPPVFEMTLQCGELVNCQTNERQSLQSLNNKTFHAVAGIGNPERFFATLASVKGANIIKHPMADHAHYGADDFEFDDEHWIIMTEKDAVKVTPFATAKMWYLEVSPSLPDAFASAFLAHIDKVIKGTTHG